MLTLIGSWMFARSEWTDAGRTHHWTASKYFASVFARWSLQLPYKISQFPWNTCFRLRSFGIFFKSPSCYSRCIHTLRSRSTDLRICLWSHLSRCRSPHRLASDRFDIRSSVYGLIHGRLGRITEAGITKPRKVSKKPSSTSNKRFGW